MHLELENGLGTPEIVKFLMRLLEKVDWVDEIATFAGKLAALKQPLANLWFLAHLTPLFKFSDQKFKTGFVDFVVSLLTQVNSGEDVSSADLLVVDK